MIHRKEYLLDWKHGTNINNSMLEDWKFLPPINQGSKILYYHGSVKFYKVSRFFLIIELNHHVSNAFLKRILLATYTLDVTCWTCSTKDVI